MTVIPPKNKSAAFTLIELLVVVGIIGVIVSLVLVSMKDVRKTANVNKVKNDIDTIVKAMKLYESDVGELPPRGDSCPACLYPNGQAAWDAVMTALLVNDGANWNGPYIGQAISKDPWGHHFIYDDNACNSNCGPSYLSTAGPDGINGTGDDYRVLVTDQNEVTGCCY